jgi:hypothetical protein
MADIIVRKNTARRRGLRLIDHSLAPRREIHEMRHAGKFWAKQWPIGMQILQLGACGSATSSGKGVTAFSIMYADFMLSPTSRVAFVLLFALTVGWGQQNDPIEMTPLEKQFQEMMTNVTMTGFFTVDDNPAAHEDKYTIAKVAKVGPDLWAFDAVIAYNNREFKATVQVPVKWAGDTPVMTLSNYLIKGHGVYSARILIHGGLYAGTWGAQAKGGKMFGKIVKNQPAP